MAFRCQLCCHTVTWFWFERRTKAVWDFLCEETFFFFSTMHRRTVEPNTKPWHISYTYMTICTHMHTYTYWGYTISLPAMMSANSYFLLLCLSFLCKWFSINILNWFSCVVWFALSQMIITPTGSESCENNVDPINVFLFLFFIYIYF